MNKPNPSPNAYPKICERFSARFPLKGRGTAPSFALWRDAIFFLRLSMISWGQFYVMEGVLRFLKTSQSFDQITTSTYVLMDNFCLCFFLCLISRKHLPATSLLIREGISNKRWQHLLARNVFLYIDWSVKRQYFFEV